MRLKVSLLSVAMMAVVLSVSAQSARNPLNHKPACVTLQKGTSAKKASDITLYLANEAPYDKHSLTYNEKGKVVTDLTRKWKADSWQNVSKEDYVYENNKMTEVSSIWREAGWEYFSKTENYYNADGKKSYSLRYLWDSDSEDWSIAPVVKSEWFYDEDKRVVEYQEQHVNPKTGTWNDCDVRILYSYDKDGNLCEELYRSMNPGSGLWIDGGKCTYSTNESGQYVVMSYSILAGDWFFDGKTVYTYDKEGNIVRSEYYGNKENEPFNAYCVYTYSDDFGFVEEEISIEDINIYPNPVVSYFELTVPEIYVGNTAFIFDLSGQPVKTIVVNADKMQVDVSGFTKGIYFLKINETTKRFVIR